ncbi:MAG TPA: BadF/BadG/BcrA/BcrD ATPase family protein [Candidatus Dormibacteraeota bacterium]
MTTVLGLDIGGSRTRACLSRDGRVVGQATAGSASLTAAGAGRAGAILEQVVRELGSPAVTAAVAGAAGCDTAPSRRRMRELLRPLLPGADVEVVHDARLVLAAAGLDAGIVLIAGTGSVAWGSSADGEEARAGGWGHLLGDEGSGHWVVREAIRRVLAAHDRGESPGPLARRLLEATGVDDPLELTAHFHVHREPERWAAFSQMALEAGEGLVEATAAELAGQAATVAGRLLAEVRVPQDSAALRRWIPALPGPVVLAGGMLLGEPALEAAVRTALGTALPGAEVVRAEAEPVAGAVRLAERLGNLAIRDPPPASG